LQKSGMVPAEQPRHADAAEVNIRFCRSLERDHFRSQRPWTEFLNHSSGLQQPRIAAPSRPVRLLADFTVSPGGSKVP